MLESAHRAEVKTLNNKVYPVKSVVAEDREADLIRLSVDISQEVVSPLSVSTSIPEVGERVRVIGVPLGLEQTVSRVRGDGARFFQAHNRA
ncbi:MAG: S1C family serine protease [bacterium]|nr:S1C family serine protease [bacterium]